MPPGVPAAVASSSTIRDTRAASTVSIAPRTSKANVSSASPARIAMASPKTLWQVGLPRRRSSLSSAGKSSWINEYVWIISSAQAAVSTPAVWSDTARAASMQRIGRMRLPPAKRL